MSSSVALYRKIELLIKEFLSNKYFNLTSKKVEPNALYAQNIIPRYLFTLTCSHVFHSTCITTFLSVKTSQLCCPICRLSTLEKEYTDFASLMNTFMLSEESSTTSCLIGARPERN